MSGTKLNRIIAGAIALVNAIIPFLVLLGALDWGADTVAAAMVIVSLAGTLIGYIFAESEATNTGGVNAGDLPAP